MRREFLIATGGYPAGMRLAEDYDLWMRGFAAGLFRYHNLGEILVLYRTRSVQRWKMIRASAGARIKAGRREHRPMTGWAAAAWILFNGGLEQSRIFVLRDALKNFFSPKPSAPLRAGPPLDPRPLHVVLVTSSLGGGGAERVLATMANHWAGLGWEVTVFTLRADEAMPAYPLHERVRVVRLHLIRERNPVLDAGHLGRLLTLRRALRSAAPDVVISFLDKLNVAVLLALVGTGTRVVVDRTFGAMAASDGRGLGDVALDCLSSSCPNRFSHGRHPRLSRPERSGPLYNFRLSGSVVVGAPWRR
jgi:hypothetical protein